MPDARCRKQYRIAVDPGIGIHKAPFVGINDFPFDMTLIDPEYFVNLDAGGRDS